MSIVANAGAAAAAAHHHQPTTTVASEPVKSKPITPGEAWFLAGFLILAFIAICGVSAAADRNL